MKIYDISQGVFGSVVYPGDPAPVKEEYRRIKRGDRYNGTSFSMHAHNGTHIDAPFHFVDEGKTIDEIAIDKLVGKCLVVSFDGVVNGRTAERMLEQLRQSGTDKLLIKGDAQIDREGAIVFAQAKLDLVGVRSQSVSVSEATTEVHVTLLKAEIVLLEGIRLEEVEEGEYLLFAAPLKLEGSDGSPVRAVLVQE